jgi:hypothetical protein
MRKGPGSAYDKWNISVTTYCHDITEILLKVALNTINHYLLSLIFLYFWDPKTSLTLPPFIEVSVPRQESERSCICVFCILSFLQQYDIFIQNDC